MNWFVLTDCMGYQRVPSLLQGIRHTAPSPETDKVFWFCKPISAHCIVSHYTPTKSTFLISFGHSVRASKKGIDKIPHERPPSPNRHTPLCCLASLRRLLANPSQRCKFAMSVRNRWPYLDVDLISWDNERDCRHVSVNIAASVLGDLMHVGIGHLESESRLEHKLPLIHPHR